MSKVLDYYREALRERERANQRAEEQQRLAEEARLAEEMTRGSPGRRSPSDVVKDVLYDHVASLDGNTWPSSIQYVVRHKPTGSLWSCLYAIRDDDSDFECATGWTCVEAKTKTITIYEPKK